MVFPLQNILRESLVLRLWTNIGVLPYTLHRNCMPFIAIIIEKKEANISLRLKMVTTQHIEGNFVKVEFLNTLRGAVSV